MRSDMKYLGIGAAFVGLVLAMPLAAPVLSTPAMAQAVGSAQMKTARATVSAIDFGRRDLTLIGAVPGNPIVVHCGDEVRNFDKIKVGDTVTARYYSSLLLVLTKPGAKTPDNSAAVAADRAAKGQLPSGAVATREQVTGLVVGVDTTANTISLVNPSGGAVLTFDVTDPERQAELKKVKVGDNITAISTKAFAVGIDQG